VSPFVGRVDDIGWDGNQLIRDIAQIYKAQGFKTQILAASMRSSLHVIEAAKAGAQVTTMPFKTMDAMFNHPLTDKGLEQFLKDYAKAFQEAPAGR
jgi:transaldolase